ncbi:MAG: CBS domain-containing protein [Actinomycetota bacterium]
MSPRAACRLEALGYQRIYDYVNGIADWKAAGLPTEGTADPMQRVIDATRTDVPTCRPDETIGEIRSRVADAGWDLCVVTDCDGRAIGRIRGAAFDADRLVVDAMETGPSTVRPDRLLQPLVQRMHDRDAEHVIVTTPQGDLLGVLIRDEAERLLAGDPPRQIWQDCDCCPGRWTSK